MSLRLWQLSRLARQRGVPATAVVLVGVVLAGLLGYTLVGSVLIISGAYALVLPAFVRPQDPTAR